MRYSGGLLVCLCLFLFGCDADDSSEKETVLVSQSQSESELALLQKVTERYSEQAKSAMDQISQRCEELEQAIRTFLEKPEDQAQRNAQEAYQQCYQAWIASSMYMSAPFNSVDNASLNRLLALIDTRPFVPGYIGGLPEYPFSGIVNEFEITLNAPNLLRQHRLLDDYSAAVGFPVIEYFLWKEPIASHWKVMSNRTNLTLVQRHKSYLSLSNRLLMKHIQQLQRRWLSSSEFMSLPIERRFTVIATSIQMILQEKLLQHSFSREVLEDPQWFHPMIYSGQGRLYLTIFLRQIYTFLESSQVKIWWQSESELPVSYDVVQESLLSLVEALDQLPENYPEGAEENSAWLNVRNNLVDLIVMLNKNFKFLGWV